MAHFSLWIQASLIIMLALYFSSDTVTSRLPDNRKPPDCKAYGQLPFYCTREYEPVCASNGISYGNECMFCLEVRKNKPSLTFEHWSEC
nr:ovomucoid-like [Saimiri boliviensis boliviensis]